MLAHSFDEQHEPELSFVILCENDVTFLISGKKCEFSYTFQLFIKIKKKGRVQVLIKA